jgi:hypothetical protein
MSDAKPKRKGRRRFLSRTSVRRYILNVCAMMLENEFNEPDCDEGWMFGGVTNLDDKKLLADELRIYIAQVETSARKLK